MPIQLATKRIFLTGLVISVAAGAMIGIAAIVFQRGWMVQEKLILTAVFIGLYSLAALGASIPFDRSHWPIISGVAIIVLISGLALTLPSLWIQQLEQSDAYIRIVGIIATVGGLLALVSLVSMARVSQRFRWLQLLTLLSALATALTIIGLIVVDPAYPGVSAWANVLGLCALLTVGGSIIVPVAHVMNRVETAERVETLELEMTIVCPRCRLKQVVKSGHSTCPGCKLRFKIEIEEPRCEKCGYLLYQLTENRCPECGEPFEQKLVASNAGDEVSGT